MLTIQNLHEGFDMAGSGICSMGLHPWYLSEKALLLPKLTNAARQPNVLAIGECGLDKVKGAPFEEQVDAFIAQVQLANRVNKPLIIHCVQAHEEVLEVFRLHRPQAPVIFHGFNRKASIAKRLTDEGYYLSFGGAILKNATAMEVLTEVSGKQFFLETDDSTATIQDIYKKAAELRNTDMETLILQLGHNFNAVFGL